MYITIWYVTVTHYSTFPRYAMITAASASHLQHLISNCATTNTKTTYTIQNPYIYIYTKHLHIHIEPSWTPQPFRQTHKMYLMPPHSTNILSIAMLVGFKSSSIHINFYYFHWGFYLHFCRTPFRDLENI